jgi:hypothetical protein
MGLDMYLQGKKFFWSNWENPAMNRTEDGLRLVELQVELGYWRKHPNLHGFIVQNFAGGVDDCRDIELHIVQLEAIITACKLGQLPITQGFFFGESPSPDDKAAYNDQIAEDVAVLQKAITWLESEERRVSRSVVYSASW